ncbi:radical SAM protein, partial [Riemerella anatipestifer]
MKNSQFNTSFFYNEKWVIYNSLKDNFILLEPLLYELYQAATNENKLDDLTNYHETLYDTLVDKGMIVDDSVDELQLVKDLRAKVDFNKETFLLTINPTMNCNFKCWYCYESHIKNSRLNDVNLKKIQSFIDNKVKNKELKYFRLSWFGGEPLLYYDKNVFPIIEYAYNRCIENNVSFSCSFTTNGYLINDKMIQDFKKYGIKGFQITLDGNEEEHNKVRYVSKSRGSYREIIN